MMRALGSLVLAVLIGILALWLVLAVFVGILKLLGILIVLALAVGVYFLAEKLLGKGR